MFSDVNLSNRSTACACLQIPTAAVSRVRMAVFARPRALERRRASTVVSVSMATPERTAKVSYNKHIT